APRRCSTATISTRASGGSSGSIASSLPRWSSRLGVRACVRLLPWHIGTMVDDSGSRHGKRKREIERVQTGIRIEKRILKVLKGQAVYHDLSLGDLLEGIVLHAFDGKAPFGKESLRKVAELKAVYGLDLDADDSHQLRERSRG